MKLLKCKVCGGEVDIIDNDRAINKKIKCLECGFTNVGDAFAKKPEVVILKRRAPSE